MSLAPGTRLGPYEVAATLGEGGMGEVYRATDTRLGRDVAVKVIAAAAAGSPDAHARLAREARAIGALSHPNICTLFDVGEEGGHTFLVMELLEGETLHQVLTRGPLPIPLVVDHATALADALDTAHTRGIIHRDLKPANVFVTMHGIPKILDFGLAKATERLENATRTLDAALTGPGTTLGTLSYMSPEQLRGDTLDARTDVFSLGLVLYEMVTGRRAFTGKTGAQVSAAILHEEPARPIDVRGDIPEQLDAIILKALEKDCDLRYQSAAELRADLKRLKRQGDPATSVAATAAVRATVSSPAPTSSSDAALAVGLARRHPVMLAGIGVAAVAAAVAAWFVVRAPAVDEAPPSITQQALTLDGQAGQATISPDGKFIAYVRSDGTRSSIVVKQLGSNSDVVIVPPSDEFDYWAPSVTPDGSYVDVLVERRRPRTRSLMRVPFLGGAGRAIVNEPVSGIGWSPDGQRMAFVRYDGKTQSSSLVVADSEGQSERVVLTRKNPLFLAAVNFSTRPPARPSWSADGRWIAVSGSNQSPARAEESAELIEVNAETGAERAVRRSGTFMPEAAYLDSDRLVVSALSQAGTGQWWLYPRTGAPLQLTDGLTLLSDVQLTADRASGVATRTVMRSSIAVGTLAAGVSEVVADSAAEPQQGQLDGFDALYYTQRVPGSFATFRSEGRAGSGALLAKDVVGALPSPDGRFAIGLSLKGELVRMNSDGSNVSTLMVDTTSSLNAFTPDGSGFVFASNKLGHQQPWMLPLPAGEPRRLSDKYLAGSQQWLSGDGRLVIFRTTAQTEICSFPSFDDCRVVDVVAGPLSADGRLVYAVDPNDPKNIIAQPIDGGPAKPVTRFTDKVIADFSLSPDRTRIAITRGTRESNVVLIKGLK